jgi:short-subunit dehydrogenase
MKILITGGTYGLGKNINETMIKSGYDTHLIRSIDSYTHYLPDIINDYYVFINNEYKDTIQTELFEYVHTHWKYEKKTIINISSNLKLLRRRKNKPTPIK